MANGIGWAVKELQNGRLVRRLGWNGKDMFLVLAGPGTPFQQANAIHTVANGKSIVAEYSQWVGMKTADNKLVPWLCSQTDLLAIDWELVG